MMLEAQGVALHEGRRRLAALDLVLPGGEVCAVLGPNGAGKSTLLALLSGMLAADTGRVLLDGRPLPEWPLVQRAQRLAVLTQQQPLDFAFSVRDVIAMGGYPLPLSADALQQRIEELLDALDLRALADRNYLSLSGGEAQRVQLARVLAQRGVEPSVILLDEPLAAMDLRHQHQALTLLQALAAQGYAVLVVLHDLNLAAHYADRVLLLAPGRLLMAGETADVLQADRLSMLYGVRIERLESRSGGVVFHSQGGR